MSNAVNAPESKAATGPASKPEPRPRRKARIDVEAAPATKPEPPIKTASKAAKPAVLKAVKPATPPRTKSQPSKRLSALDAAAQLLAGLSKSEVSTGITAPDLIERMAKARLWSSPGGKTPAATLYAAMVREITRKGAASRFLRLAPGRFAPSGRTGAPDQARGEPTPAATGANTKKPSAKDTAVSRAKGATIARTKQSPATRAGKSRRARTKKVCA